LVGLGCFGTQNYEALKAKNGKWKMKNEKGICETV